ncbi:MAG TPA: hypothetical protein VLF42_09765 [Burkholderiales bacterium]|nr:hypothetical protein [Burkholderiales bacterium]
MRSCVTTLVALVFGSWVASAAALDRNGAIEAAKRQMKTRCTSETPCTFTARAERDKWHVHVEYPGGQAIFIINQTGKVIGRVEGK